MKLKYLFLIGAFIFLWIGSALYQEQPERLIYAYTAWVTAGLSLFVAMCMAVKECGM